MLHTLPFSSTETRGVALAVLEFGFNRDLPETLEPIQ